MFVGSDATGRSYHLQFSTTKETVVAFQNIPRDDEPAMSPILLTLICFHVLQFLGTILFYCKILLVAYRSTTKVATRVIMDDNLVELTKNVKPNQTSQNTLEDVNRELNHSSNIQEQNSVKTISSQLDQQDTETTKNNNTKESFKVHNQKLLSIRGKNKNSSNGKCPSATQCKVHKSCRYDTQDNIKTTVSRSTTHTITENKRLQHVSKCL